MTHEEILTTLGHYVDYLIAGSTAEAPLWNIEKVRSGKPNKWNYIDGCMITACLSLYKTTGDEKFLDFSKKFLDYFVKDNGVIETYDPAEYNLDNVNQGKNLFTLYDLTGDQRYRDAIETIRGQLETQPRTKEGNFWHKKIYPNQVWLDGTYMAQPFYMEYETRCNGMHGCIDSYKQFMNIQKHMKDPKTGLYYHGYDESREMYWADPVTGCSANFWLRAMGWFLVAMVDVLERMDEMLYYEYRAIMSMLKDAVDAMIAFQDAESGMFWQVIDKAGVEGNYLETSGSALFAYAVLKGVRLGYLPKRYTAYGEKSFYGTCDRHLGVGADGAAELTVRGKMEPGDYVLPGDVSSQFVSGLLFALPLLPGNSTLTVQQPVESESYIRMTIEAIAASGIEVQESNAFSWRIPGHQQYKSHSCHLNGDYSQAAVLCCAGALGHDITVTHLSPVTTQGDRAILRHLMALGATVEESDNHIRVKADKLHGATLDMHDCPDIAPILALTAQLAEGESRLTHCGRLRLKECDRLAATVEILNLLGGNAQADGDDIVLHGVKQLRGGVTLPNYGDHRMVMLASIAATKCEQPIEMDGIEAIDKSWPEYLKVYQMLGGKCE